MDENNNSLGRKVSIEAMFSEKIPRTLRETVVVTIFGIILVLFAALLFLLGFSKGGDPVLFSAMGAFLLGLSVLFFSPWKRFNLFIGGILLFCLAWAFYILLPEAKEDQYLLTEIWIFGFGLGGLSLILQSLNTTLLASIKKIFRLQAFRLIAKIVFWCCIILIGLLVFGGIFSIIAGLSATTIIIILLIMLLLK